MPGLGELLLSRGAESEFEDAESPEGAWGWGAATDRVDGLNAAQKWTLRSAEG